MLCQGGNDMQEKTVARWRPGGRVALWLGLLVWTAGWSTPLRPPAQGQSAPVLAEQSRHMAALYDARRGDAGERLSLPLDLSSDTEYGFVLHRLAAAGKSARNSPELFGKLSWFRERALLRRRLGRLESHPQEAATAAAAAPWCDHYLLVTPPVSSNNGTTLLYQPYVRVACQGGASYVYADLVAYDTNEAETDNKLLASSAGEEYGGGTDFVDVTASVSLNVVSGRLLRLESLALAVDDATGRDTVSYTVARTSVAFHDEGGFTLVHPRELVPQTPSDILMCQQRGGSDCDYAVVGLANGVPVASANVPTGVAAALPASPGAFSPTDYWPFAGPFDPTHLYVPLRLEISAGADNALQCTVDHYTYGRVRLLSGSDGETCSNAVDFIDQLPRGSHAATFNYLADTSYLLNEDRPSAPQCQSSVVLNKAVSLSVTVMGQARCRSQDGSFALEPFYKSATIDGHALTARRLFFRNACLAEGTRIHLADGRRVPVERVKVGDRVLTGSAGASLPVVEVLRGEELKPLVRLRDGAGHTVTLTELHPVLGAGGEAVAAGQLRVGDRVRTARGVGVLTSVTRVPVGGQPVFNLRLGSASGHAAEGSRLLAEGFLVGDVTLPVSEAPAARDEALTRLSPGWRRDYLSALERGAHPARR